MDLLHFFPSATHLATSALIGPLAAFAAGAPERQQPVLQALLQPLASTGSPSRADISALFSAGKPLRPRRACSAAIVDLLHLFPLRNPLGDFFADASAAAAGGAAAGAAGAAGVATGAGVLAGAAGAATPPSP